MKARTNIYMNYITGLEKQMRKMPSQNYNYSTIKSMTITATITCEDNQKAKMTKKNKSIK